MREGLYFFARALFVLAFFALVSKVLLLFFSDLYGVALYSTLYGFILYSFACQKPRNA